MEKLKAEDLEQVTGGRTSEEKIGEICQAIMKAKDEGKPGEEFMEKILPTLFKGEIPDDAYTFAAGQFWY